MRTPAVQALCLKIWDQREQGLLRPFFVDGLSRALVTAAALDVENVPDYVPADDKRLAWAFEVLKVMRGNRGVVRPQAIAELEATAAMLLGRDELLSVSGKDLAAGEGQECPSSLLGEEVTA